MKKAIIVVLVLFAVLGLTYYGICQSRMSDTVENDSIALSDTCLVIPDTLGVDSIIVQADSICNE